jgi:hypothetical protein
MENPSIEDFLFAAIQNAYRIALECRVYRRIVSTDSELQVRAGSALSDHDFVQKQEDLTALIHGLRKAVESQDLKEVSAICGALSGKVTTEG